VLETRPRTAAAGEAKGEKPSAGPRFGFTVTKQLGGAVARNRIRRRLKAAVALLTGEARPNYDYVLIARAEALERAFAEIKKDLERALQRVHHAPAPRGRGKPRPQ
jgi:ribonuclease P protein component